MQLACIMQLVCIVQLVCITQQVCITQLVCIVQLVLAKWRLGVKPRRSTEDCIVPTVVLPRPPWHSSRI